MGKNYSKEEVNIAQNGSQVENQVNMQSYTLIAITTLLCAAFVFLVWNRCRSSAKSWLRKELLNSTPPTRVVTIPNVAPTVTNQFAQTQPTVGQAGQSYA